MTEKGAGIGAGTGKKLLDTYGPVAEETEAAPAASKYSRPPQERKTRRTVVLLTERQYRAVSELAKEAGQTVSGLIVDILEAEEEVQRKLREGTANGD